MWLALGLLAFTAIGPIVIIFFIFTGGLRTRNGPIIGLQRSPQELDEMVARVKVRQARYDRWLRKLR